MANLTNCCHCIETVIMAVDALTPGLPDGVTLQRIQASVRGQAEHLRRLMVIPQGVGNRVRCIRDVEDLHGRIWLALDTACDELQTALREYRGLSDHERGVIQFAAAVLVRCRRDFEALPSFALEVEVVEEEGVMA